MESHLIANCCRATGESCGGDSLFYHACSPVITWVISCGLVCSCFIHTVNVCIVSVHLCWALSCRHWRMCCLSSRGQSHLGQLAKVHCFHWTIFFLWAKWPDICLEAQWWQLSGTSCMSLPKEGQLTISKMGGLRFFCVAQYFCLLSMDEGAKGIVKLFDDTFISGIAGPWVSW